MNYFKNFYFFMLLIMAMILFSCSDQTEELQRLDVEDLKLHIPYMAYTSSDIVVYKDEFDNVKKFRIEHESATSTLDDYGIRYENDSEKFLFFPITEADGELIFRIELKAFYSNKKPERQIKLNQVSPQSVIYALNLNEHGLPNNGAVEDLVILDDLFEGVSISSHVFTNNRGAGFYFNSVIGIIGFKDEEDRLWKFERFE